MIQLLAEHMTEEIYSNFATSMPEILKFRLITRFPLLNDYNQRSNPELTDQHIATNQRSLTRNYDKLHKSKEESVFGRFKTKGFENPFISSDRWATMVGRSTMH